MEQRLLFFKAGVIRTISEAKHISADVHEPVALNPDKNLSYKTLMATCEQSICHLSSW